VSDAEVAAELEKHDILVEVSPSDRITRAEKHRLTSRKPARLLNTEEARAVLFSREAAITGSTIAELRDQVERFYAVEGSPNYGYPRLQDRTETSLFQHLHKAGLVHLSAQEDAKHKIPKTGWVSAGAGLPIAMMVARAYFLNIGEKLEGDFQTPQMREGWARIKNRTSLPKLCISRPNIFR